MSELAEDIRLKMMGILKQEENKTDLDNLVVLSRVGLKVASSTSAELDADATSASSTALIDLGLRLSEATHHGALREIILHNESGYTILMAINDDYIVFGGLSNIYRIGYYLGYFQELTKRLNLIVTGEEISDIALSLQEEELKKTKEKELEKEKEARSPRLPSSEQDKAAMDDLLTYLDKWDQEEKEMMGVDDFEDLENGNIISIPGSMTVGLPKSGEVSSIQEDKSQEIKQKTDSKFKIYEDEVPPVPLEDYTPMDVEEETSQATEYEETPVKSPIQKPAGPTFKEFPAPPQKGELPPLNQLPSFDQLSIPDFGAQSASEYDTEFILKEESEALDSVLKDLGWEEED